MLDIQLRVKGSTFTHDDPKRPFKIRNYKRIREFLIEQKERMKSKYVVSAGVLNKERYPLGKRQQAFNVQAKARYSQSYFKRVSRKPKYVSQIAFFLEYGTSRLSERRIFRTALRWTQQDFPDGTEDPEEMGQALVQNIRTEIEETNSIDTKRFFNSISYKIKQRNKSKRIVTPKSTPKIATADEAYYSSLPSHVADFFRQHGQ